MRFTCDRLLAFAQLATENLLKIAYILHEMYHSYDLAALAFSHVGRQENSKRQAI